jgi:ribosome recycling factor
VSTEDDTLVGAVLEDARDKMHKAIEHTQADFSGVRTGRATPGLIENLKADYYGTETALQKLASFSVPEPRLLVVSPFDKSSLKAIEKAIQNSDVGLNPSNDGAVIRLAFPALTEERRKELVKMIHTKAEDGRIAVRNVRRAARKELEGFEHDGDISTDELDRAEKDLEKVTHAQIAEIDRMVQHKEAELLEV